MSGIEKAKERETSAPQPTGSHPFFPRGFFTWSLSLFLLGFGMKLLMLQRCINPLPYYDQWEGEAIAIYLPYFQHTLGLADLFHPQNEHRIFFTHVYDLLLLWLNGQWDSQLQMVLNAVIHCGTVAGFGWVLAGMMGRRYWVCIWIPLAIAVTSPFGWENALCGFQSQFYFLLLFSLLTMWWLESEPKSLRWKWGILAGACALLTMASGLLAAVAVAAVVMLDLLKDPRDWRRFVPTLAVCAALAVAGLLLKGRAAGEENWHAESVGAFLSSLGNNLSWPTGRRPWLAPFNLFPLLLLARVYFLSREKNLAAERIILAVGFLVILQSVATAYARGFHGLRPAWRYMDTLCFLFMANFLSIALLVGKYRSWLRFPRFWCVAFALWLIPSALSLYSLNKLAWNEAIPNWARRQETRLAMTRAFMATDDEKVFASNDPLDLPWFYVSDLAHLLRAKEIRSILPTCARESLPVLSGKNDASAFITNGCLLTKPEPPTEHCLGSYSQGNAAARGTFESAPMTSRLPYLEIPVAGDLGDTGLSLDLIEISSGKVFPVTLNIAPGKEWLNADVKAPTGEFEIVARDDSTKGWFAFKEPRELGRLSFWAERVIHLAKWFLGFGFISLMIAVAVYCRSFAKKAMPNPSC